MIQLPWKASPTSFITSYCAFEGLFKTIADFFENTIEEPARYRRELLRRMRLSIEGVRPALLAEGAFKLLDSLRAFRHFFGHAYSYKLDPKRSSLSRRTPWRSGRFTVMR